jgi:hypothetical protein
MTCVRRRGGNGDPYEFLQCGFDAGESISCHWTLGARRPVRSGGQRYELFGDARPLNARRMNVARSDRGRYLRRV